MMLWEETPRDRYMPRMFTPAEWDSMSPKQRELVTLQRKAVVQALALDHQRRFHSAAHFIALDVALHNHEE